GLTLAVVGQGQTSHLFSFFRLDPAAKTVTPLAKDVGQGGSLGASAISPNGKLFAVGMALSGHVAIYDTAANRWIAQHPSAHASPPSTMAFSGDGAKLATADFDGTIKIWTNIPTLSSKSTATLLKGHQAEVTSLGFSSDGKRLVSTAADKTARVWDLENAG